MPTESFIGYFLHIQIYYCLRGISRYCFYIYFVYSKAIFPRITFKKVPDLPGIETRNPFGDSALAVGVGIVNELHFTIDTCKIIPT